MKDLQFLAMKAVIDLLEQELLVVVFLVLVPCLKHLSLIFFFVFVSELEYYFLLIHFPFRILLWTDVASAGFLCLLYLGGLFWTFFFLLLHVGLTSRSLLSIVFTKEFWSYDALSIEGCKAMKLEIGKDLVECIRMVPQSRVEECNNFQSTWKIVKKKLGKYL